MQKSTDNFQFGDTVNLRRLLWHEFGHSFVNPVVDANSPLVASCASLYPPIAAKMQAQNYGLWQVSVYENVVRAMVSRMLANYATPQEGDIEFCSSGARVSLMCRRWRSDYVNTKPIAIRILDFADFAPRLLSALTELVGREFSPTFFLAPYSGTINSVATERDRIVFVIPTGEDDKSVESLVRAYALRVSDILFPNATVMDDTEALARDLSANSVLA